MEPNYPCISESDALWERALEAIPAGTQTYSKGPHQFVMGLSPKYLERGKGCHVWDVDGNRYIDFNMGCQPIILGYCDPDVDYAIRTQLDKGITFSMMHPLEVEVAEKLIEMVPCAEGVRFGKNGADATSAAVRVGRAVTGRDHVAYCGYHGWHDWYIANTDLNSGIPNFNQQITHAFAYNELDTLQAIFEQYPDQIACVIMEPVQVAPPLPGFLEAVQQMARDHGAVLIFDEIVTGFRFAEGGAQELFGVIPDLACFAKGMSNGMPLSAVTGKKEFIQALEKTFFSFTYGGECLSLAAAKASMNKVQTRGVIDHLATIGERLKSGINALAANYGVEELVQCTGYPCRTIVAFGGGDRFDPAEVKTFVQQEMIKRGVLCNGFHSISFSHDEDIIDYTLEVYDDTFKALKSVLDRNIPLTDELEGPVIRPVFKRVADFMAQQTSKD